MEWAKLNVFQRIARQWDAMHPYNAAQLMRLGGAPDLARLEGAWRETLVDLGLGPLRVMSDRYRFESPNGDARRYGVEQVDPRTSPESLLTRELNRPFEDGEFPLRPFVLASRDSHCAGVVYHHWVADSASIRTLMREWFLRVYDPARARRAPLRTPDGGYWRAFGPVAGGWNLGEGLLASVRWTSRLKRVRRINASGFDDYRTHVTLHELPDGFVDDLRRAARGTGATLNDVFLAAVAQLSAAHPWLERPRRRRDLAVGSIVDLRARSVADMSDVFGLFLGFTNVVCRPGDLRDWDRLLHRVAAQAGRHKRAGVPEASMIRLLAGVVAHRLLRPESLKQFYRKRVPLAGGVSNVNLNHFWPQRYHPAPLLDYVRVSPCGPVMPLVVTTTTLGGRLNFGLTCRASLITIDEARAIGEAFVERLRRLVATEKIEDRG